MAAAGGVLAMAAGYAHADAKAAGGTANSPGVGSGNTIQAPIDVPVNVCGNTVDVVGLLNPAFGNHCANGSGGRHGGGHDRGHGQGGKHRRTSGEHGGATAVGGAKDSPGVASGNTIQAPIDVPINVCGNSVDVVGALNPSFGNDCDNASPTGPGHPHHPGHPSQPGQPPEQGHPGNPGGPHHPGTPHQPGHPGGPHEPRSVAPQTPGTPHTPGTSGVRTQTAGAPHTRNAATPQDGAGQLAHTGAGALGYAIPGSAGLLLGGAILYRRARTVRS
ncbi:chaplin family protein [Streptomyces sp. NPDC058000]|uniref:chaplin n=1 Tax=Streptomyces sp. NPDC058000 TaxID=3346299 RepID=UPI0036E642C2